MDNTKRLLGNEMKNIKKVQVKKLSAKLFFEIIDSVLTSKTSCFTIF
jgi:hypothetical protein